MKSSCAIKNLLVMKFGGAAFSTLEDFNKRSSIIADRLRIYDQLVVVVSAMYEMTDSLLNLSTILNDSPPQREQDMLISVGERISMSLLAIALDNQGIEARSFTGSQAGIITTNHHLDAEIVELEPFRLVPHLKRGKVVIVAGFQGVSREGEVTTLGRGGSDTTAVALGASLNARHIEFYKDVEGVFSEDPKVNSDAKQIPRMSYEEASEILGASKKEILHSRALHLAQKNSIPLKVFPFNHPADNVCTIIGEKKLVRSKPMFELV